MFAPVLVELKRLAEDIDREPAAVGLRAAALLREARRLGDHAVTARAATLVARAHRDLRQMEAAELAIGDAIEQATFVGGDALADAHMVAASIASYRSGAEATDHHLQLALHHASAALAWKVRVQQAIAADRCGRLDEALDRYDKVIADVAGRDDPVVLARLRSNRGNVRGLRGDLDGAIDDYRASIDLFQDAGQAFAVAVVTQNLAEATARLGDAPAALDLHDAAAGLLADIGHPMFDAHTSKAEALIDVGLFADAIELLAKAAEAQYADGDRTGAAEALLVQAEALRLAGRPSHAIAERAQRIFATLGADGFAAQAELEMLRAATNPTVEAIRPNQLRRAAAAAERLAGELRSTGATRSAIDALALASTMSLELGDIERAASLADACDQLAADAVFVEHRLAVVHARAAVRGELGDYLGAVSAITDVLDQFDHYRATIGSPDGRRGSAVHAASLETLGGTLVARSGDPIDLLAWSEHRRCSHLQSVFGPAPGDATRDSIVHELRSILGELRHIDGQERNDADTVALLDRRGELERRLREVEVRRGRPDVAPVSTRGASHASVEALVSSPELQSATAVSIDVHDGELVAVVVSGGGVRRVSLGSERDARRLAMSTRAVLCDVADDSGPVEGQAIRRYRRAIAGLDEFLRSLDLPAGPLVLALPPAMHAVPWCATPTLRARPVTIATALTAWLDRQQTAAVPPSPAVAAFAGPRLAHAQTEVEAVLACYGTSATSGDLGTALQECDVVHVAAHARLRADNPLWSSIEVDGGPVEAHRFVGCSMRSALVVLSTCDSAVPTGHSVMAFGGFAATLSAGGVGSIVATVGRLPDASDTVDVVRTFHRHISLGERPAVALAATRTNHPDSISADSYLCWGAG